MNIPASSRFDGDVALVTGALNGIGLATAMRLHAEGARVILSDLAGEGDTSTRDTLALFGDRCRYIQLDAQDELGWNTARDSVANAEGRLDILVHNAGAATPGLLEDVELAAWRRVQAINSDALFMGTKAFTPMMAQSGQTRTGGASIVVVASMLGNVGFSNSIAYVTSKGAARLFTKAAAVEFASRRMPIRVNSVHPGFVATKMTLAGLAKIAAESGLPSVETIIADLNSKTPMGRMGEPDEIASAIAFLASADAAFMTGSELIVDGGYTAQ